MSSFPAGEPILIAADAIVPMDPVLPKILRHAGVVIQGGRITAVGELSELRRRFGTLPETRERPRGILLPGFINAHTHLELSNRDAGSLTGGHFTQWVSRLMAGYPQPDALEATVRQAVRKGAAESLIAGVTSLGDISRHSGITRDELARGGHMPRVVSYGEVVGLGKMRERAGALIEAAMAMPPPAPARAAEDKAARLIPGLSPHAPYTVEGPTLRACVREAVLRSAPIAMHLAELSEEIEFLSDLAGPLGRDWDLMQKMDVMDDQIPRMQGGPIRWAQRWGLLLADAGDSKPRQFPVLLAHVNYCDRGELAQLAVSRASVAYCPRTHAYFGHPPHRYRDMIDNGINVCLGTDSLASNPDLSVLREAQLICRRDGFDPYTALKMITQNAADGIGMGKSVGSLSPGKLADMVLLPVTEYEDVMREIMLEAPRPEAVWMDGIQVDKAMA